MIGAVIGLLAFIVGGLIFCRKKRRDSAEGPKGVQERVQDAPVAQIDGYEVLKQDESSRAQHSNVSISQLDGNAVYELGPR